MIRFLVSLYVLFKKWQTHVCFPSLKKSKKCVCGKNPSSEADLFVRFFCGFLETASRRCGYGRQAGASAQFGGGCPPENQPPPQGHPNSVRISFSNCSQLEQSGRWRSARQPFCASHRTDLPCRGPMPAPHTHFFDFSPA